jgi:hypothetical protein
MIFFVFGDVMGTFSLLLLIAVLSSPFHLLWLLVDISIYIYFFLLKIVVIESLA